MGIKPPSRGENGIHLVHKAIFRHSEMCGWILEYPPVNLHRLWQIGLGRLVSETTQKWWKNQGPCAIPGSSAWPCRWLPSHLPWSPLQRGLRPWTWRCHLGPWGTNGWSNFDGRTPEFIWVYGVSFMNMNYMFYTWIIQFVDNRSSNKKVKE